MHLLLLNQVFHPDVAATAQHAHDLGRHLVERGHSVTVIASRSIYGEKGATLPKRETVDGIDVRRVSASLFGKAGLVARAVDFALFYVAAAWTMLLVRRPDVVVCFTTPPFIALLGWLLRGIRGSRYVYWVMDLYPEVPIGCGVMRAGSLPARLMERLNRFCLARADRVVVLGRCMERRVLDKGIPADRVQRIGVWCDPHEVRPTERSENPYRATWDLGDRFVVMYSGNFGLAHEMATICGAAAALADDDRVRFVFAGGGKRKAEVEAYVGEHDLANCVLAPYQPREALDDSLSCADVHLVSLREGLEGTIVPCKLFGIMAVARPTIYIGHPDSEIAQVLVEHDCGVLIREGDVDGLVAAIRDLADDHRRATDMGHRARTALCNAYDRGRACETWRELLENLVNPPL